MVLRRVRRHDGRAPRPTHQRDLPCVAPRADELHRAANVAHGHVRRYERRVRGRRLIHLGRTRRPAVAAQIDQPDVPPVARQEVHERDAAERQVERGLRWIRGPVHEQEHAIGRQVPRVLVAQVELDARRIGRNHVLFHPDGRFTHEVSRSRATRRRARLRGRGSCASHGETQERSSAQTMAEAVLQRIACSVSTARIRPVARSARMATM